MYVYKCTVYSVFFHQEKLSKERHLMTATLLEEETKRDSLAKVIELAGAKCAELAGVNETLEELLSQLQPLVDECVEKMKPSEHITRSVNSSHISHIISSS